MSQATSAGCFVLGSSVLPDGHRHALKPLGLPNCKMIDAILFWKYYGICGTVASKSGS